MMGELMEAAHDVRAEVTEHGDYDDMGHDPTGIGVGRWLEERGVDLSDFVEVTVKLQESVMQMGVPPAIGGMAAAAMGIQVGVALMERRSRMEPDE